MLTLHVEVSRVGLVGVGAMLSDVFDVIEGEAPEITGPARLDPRGSRIGYPRDA